MAIRLTRPAPHERRHGAAFVALGVALFATGAALAFWTLPRALEF